MVHLQMNGRDEVPSIEKILEGLQTLPERARNLTDDDLAIELKQTIVGCNDLEELLVLNAIHIPLHAGKIEEMSRILKKFKINMCLLTVNNTLTGFICLKGHFFKFNKYHLYQFFTDSRKIIILMI